MIYVGIDDTDTLVDPGTNKLAQHLVRELAGAVGRVVVHDEHIHRDRQRHKAINHLRKVVAFVISGDDDQRPDEHQDPGEERRSLLQGLHDQNSIPIA